MKQLIGWIMLLFCSDGYGQTTDELLNQKRTQIRYLAEQIAALKVYAGHLQKGYTVVRSGLTVVDDLKKGEFSQHKKYFNGLFRTKPAIYQSWKAAAVLLSVRKLMILYRSSSQDVQTLFALDKESAKAVSRAWSGLLTALANGLADLEITAGSTSIALQDEVRLSRIDILYEEMMQHERFAIDLSASVKGAVAQLQVAAATGRTMNRLLIK